MAGLATATSPSRDHRSIVVNRNARLAVIVILAAMLVIPVASLIGLGVSAGDDPSTETISIPRDGVADAEVEIRMGAGALRIEPGAIGLMEATFTSTDEAVGRVVAYEVADGTGHLSVEQAGGAGFVAPWDWGQVEHAWDIKLAPEVPIALDVRLGAGAGTLSLGGLDLTALAIETGAGSTTVDLDGNWEHDLRATIEAGAGNLRVVVPDDPGVIVRASVDTGEITVDGLVEQHGAWVNAAYGRSPVTIEIVVRGGVGNVDIALASAD